MTFQYDYDSAKEELRDALLDRYTAPNVKQTQRAACHVRGLRHVIKVTRKNIAEYGSFGFTCDYCDADCYEGDGGDGICDDCADEQAREDWDDSDC